MVGRGQGWGVIRVEPSMAVAFVQKEAVPDYNLMRFVRT